MSIYTAAQLVTKIQAIDTEIEDLRAKLLNYKVGAKTVNQDRRLELLLKNRQMLVEQHDSIAATKIAEKVIPVDYDMDSAGVQHGDILTGDE